MKHEDLKLIDAICDDKVALSRLELELELFGNENGLDLSEKTKIEKRISDTHQKLTADFDASSIDNWVSQRQVIRVNLEPLLFYSTTTNETLTHTLANNYNLYKSCEFLKKHTELLFPKEVEMLDVFEKRSTDSMKTILNQPDLNKALIESAKINQALQNEARRKALLDPYSFDPYKEEYNLLYGERPKLNSKLSEFERSSLLESEHPSPTELKHNSLMRNQFLLRRAAHLSLGLQRGQLLKVNENSAKDDMTLINDKETRTKMLAPHERDQYRVLIRDGKIMKYDRESGKASPVTTATMQSHEKRGYCAYTLSADGEMCLFNHKDKTDRVAHSTMTQGGLVLCAGEMKITDGKIDVITSYSGHYLPGIKNVFEILKYLKEEQSVNLSDMKVAFKATPNPLPNVVQQDIELPKQAGETLEQDGYLDNLDNAIDIHEYYGLKHVYNAIDVYEFMLQPIKELTEQEKIVKRERIVNEEKRLIDLGEKFTKEIKEKKNQLLETSLSSSPNLEKNMVSKNDDSKMALTYEHQVHLIQDYKEELHKLQKNSTKSEIPLDKDSIEGSGFAFKP